MHRSTPPVANYLTCSLLFLLFFLSLLYAYVSLFFLASLNLPSCSANPCEWERSLSWTLFWRSVSTSATRLMKRGWASCGTCTVRWVRAGAVVLTVVRSCESGRTGRVRKTLICPKPHHDYEDHTTKTKESWSSGQCGDNSGDKCELNVVYARAVAWQLVLKKFKDVIVMCVVERRQRKITRMLKLCAHSRSAAAVRTIAELLLSRAVAWPFPSAC